MLTKWLHPSETAHFEAWEDAVHLISEGRDRAAGSAALQRELRQVKAAIRDLRARETSLVRALMARTDRAQDRHWDMKLAPLSPARGLSGDSFPAAGPARQGADRAGPSKAAPTGPVRAKGTVSTSDLQTASDPPVRGAQLTFLPRSTPLDGADANVD